MEPGEVLKELDLTESESTVYMTLLRNGEDTASAVAKQAGIHRRLAYDVVESLTEKGLVSYVDEENRRVYKATSPERLHELIEDKRTDLEELEEQVDAVLPDLMAHFTAEKDDRDVKVLQGKEGIKHLFNDELREGETIYLIGSPEESEDILKYFLPSWTAKRQDKDIKIKGVFEHRMRGMVGEHEPIEHRYLPEDYKSSVSMAIYGSKVGIIFWIDNPLVIMIEDQDAADSFMSYFDLVWESAEA